MFVLLYRILIDQMGRVNRTGNPFSFVLVVGKHVLVIATVDQRTMWSLTAKPTFLGYICLTTVPPVWRFRRVLLLVVAVTRVGRHGRRTICVCVAMLWQRTGGWKFGCFSRVSPKAHV